MRLQNAPAVLCLAALMLGCDALGPASIAGTYEATSFVVTETGEAPVDVLAAGGTFTLIITAANTTTGILTLPGSLVGGPDVSFDMDGTMVRNGDTVQFQQAADTFVRDITWNVHGNILHGELTSAGVTVAVTLTRQ